MLKSNIDCLNEFKCALAEDNHFLVYPIILYCGHSICKTCLPNNSSHVKCNMCGKLNESSKIQESFLIKNLFSKYLNEMFETVKNSFQESVKIVQGNLHAD